MHQMKPLQSKAYEYMKDRIQENGLEAGVIYSETKMASEIGISRTPFRDAIHRLMQEGYIDIIPSKGFMLHELNKGDIIETYQMRNAIEGYCAMQVARENKTENAKKLFQKLQELLEEQERCAKINDIKEFVSYDNEFHMELVAYVNNMAFNDMFSMYMYRIRSLASSTLMHEGRVKETLIEHQNLLDSMMSGDRVRVDDAVAAHMERAEKIARKDAGIE